jgi:hypothetical protein
MKVTTIAGMIALATAGMAAAGEPAVLTDAQLDQVTAGSHMGSFSGAEILHEGVQPSGTHLVHIELNSELGRLDVLNVVTVETQGTSLEGGALFGVQFSQH